MRLPRVHLMPLTSCLNIADSSGGDPAAAAAARRRRGAELLPPSGVASGASPSANGNGTGLRVTFSSETHCRLGQAAASPAPPPAVAALESHCCRLASPPALGHLHVAAMWSEACG